MLIIDLTSSMILGVMTALHPCLFVLNMMALTAIYGSMQKNFDTMIRGIVFVSGRIFAYVSIGLVFVAGAMTMPQVTEFLEYYVNLLSGPLFILIGMFVADLFNHTLFDYHTLLSRDNFITTITQRGSLFILGTLHTVLFCPVSAGLFFGIVIPMAEAKITLVMLTALYGTGTGLPLLIIVLVTISGKKIIFFNQRKHQKFIYWYPKIAGSTLIIFGVYLTLSRIFHIPWLPLF